MNIPVRWDSLIGSPLYHELKQAVNFCVSTLGAAAQSIDSASLAACALELQRCGGALKIAGARVAALLADEIRQHIGVLDTANAQILAPQLVSALAELDHALESDGDVGVNWRLFDSVNRLRQARKVAPLPVNEFYTLDLDAVMVQAREAASDIGLSALAREQSAQFQAALLSWYRDSGNREALDSLIDIAEQLRDVAPGRLHIQLFEVVAALLECQAACGRVSQPIRLLLAHVERYVRQLGASGSGVSYVPTALIKEALFHIASQGPMASPRINDILNRYGLRDRRGNHDERVGKANLIAVAGADDALEGIESDSLRSALHECRQELAAIESLLETWLADEAGTAVLRQGFEKLQRVHHCFHVLGLERNAAIALAAQRYVLDLYHHVAEQGEREVDASRYLPFAEVLAALACTLDNHAYAASGSLLEADNLLQLAEQRLADLGIDIGGAAVSWPLPPAPAPEAVIDSAATEASEAAEFMDDADALLGDLDSLIATSDLLTLPSEGISEWVQEGAGALAPNQNSEVTPEFYTEAGALIEELNALQASWQQAPQDDAPRHAMQRILHTLKGAAQVAGHRAIGDLCHGLESVLASVATGMLSPSPALMASVAQALDSMGRALDQLARGLADTAAARPLAETPLSPMSVSAVAGTAEHRYPLSAHQLQRLFQLSAEHLVEQGGLSNDLKGVLEAAAEFDRVISRLTHELAETASALPATTSIRLSEVVDDLRLASSQVIRYGGSAEASVDRLRAAAALMRSQLLETRMAAVDSEEPVYNRIVEQTAGQLNKSVSFTLRSAAIKLDKTLLAQLNGVIAHLLRNAVDHAIEPEQVRLNAGKPASGAVTLNVASVVDGFLIEVIDDGMGIDGRAVWRRAQAIGLVGKQAQFDAARAIDLLFDPALTTKSQITPVSGRGVGLDAVKTHVEKLGGKISVATEFGKGSTFAIWLPFRYGLLTATIVVAAQQRFALPLLNETVIVSVDSVAEAFDYQGERYVVSMLDSLLGLASAQQTQAAMQAILVDHEGQKLALVVDKVEGEEPIIIESSGPQLSRASYLSGIGLLAEGDLVALLAWPYLLRHALKRDAVKRDPATPSEMGECSPTILVVDDSPTTRRYCQRILQSYGWRAVLAKTAEQALTLAEATPIDVLITDLQLPGMDGYELLAQLRALPRYAQLPSIVISASAPNDERVAQLGIDACLHKPYQERELGAAVKALLAKT